MIFQLVRLFANSLRFLKIAEFLNQPKTYASRNIQKFGEAANVHFHLKYD